MDSKKYSAYSPIQYISKKTVYLVLILSTFLRCHPHENRLLTIYPKLNVPRDNKMRPTVMKRCRGQERATNGGNTVLQEYVANLIMTHGDTPEGRRYVMRWYGYVPGDISLRSPHHILTTISGDTGID